MPYLTQVPQEASRPATMALDLIALLKVLAMPEEYDVVVAGAGLAGHTAALAFARLGFSVAVVSPKPAHLDRRTTALLANSVDFLTSLGVWDGLADKAAPLKTMRIIDATNRLLRAPELSFHASEIDLPAFGYNVANTDLTEALSAACTASGKITSIDDTLEDAVFGSDAQILTTANGRTIATSLIVGADGRSSAVRRLAKLGEREWNYPQQALVLNFKHTLPHDDASTEFHTAEGPFTFVPMERRRCGLVWVMQPQKAEVRKNLPNADLERQIERQMQSMLGKINVDSPVQSWPMTGLSASSFGRSGAILVGEAAHVFPPIGAQGFNLGIRDVELAASLGSNLPASRLSEIGSAYNTKRRLDIHTRTLSVDLLNRSLLSGFLPVQMARLAGLHALASIGPLRRMAMREGVSPGWQLKQMAEKLIPGR